MATLRVVCIGCKKPPIKILYQQFTWSACVSKMGAAFLDRRIGLVLVAMYLLNPKLASRSSIRQYEWVTYRDTMTKMRFYRTTTPPEARHQRTKGDGSRITIAFIK